MEWFDPKQVLVNLRFIELNLPADLDERVRRLRTNQLKEWREARFAALIAYGFGVKVVNAPTFVSKTEKMDFDFVMKWQSGSMDHYFPVQLKELPPDDINSRVSLDDIYDKLERYVGHHDLSVVICINRQTRFEFQPWNRPSNPRIKELWYLGCQSADQSTWFLYGSTLGRNPQKFEFNYPDGEPKIP